MRAFIFFLFGLAVVGAIPKNPQRIVGGSTTTISQYPSLVALLSTQNYNTYWQHCGGAIINARSILTAAHCPVGDPVSAWRVRVGSTYANSGGVVHLLQTYILHPQYNIGARFNNDIAIMRTSTAITLNNSARPGMFAGPNYVLYDNQVVWAAGWGAIYYDGPSSEVLRHVQVWTVNQNTCAQNYRQIGWVVNDNMLCSGYLNVGGRDQCQGDSGGPLYHNGNIVGICSWGQECALARYPGVNTRVSRYSAWIQANA